MTFGTFFFDAAHHAQHAAAHAHCHHGPHFGGFFVGAGLTLLGIALLRRLFLRRRFGRWHRRGPRRFLRYLFRRLDTSPSQEKVIREALAEMRVQAFSLRGEGRDLRESLGRTLEADELDELTLGAVFDAPTAKLGAVKEAITRALMKVHEVLTPSQRKELSVLLAQGPGHFHHRRGC